MNTIVRLLVAGEALVLIGFTYQGYVWLRQWQAWHHARKATSQNRF